MQNNEVKNPPYSGLYDDIENFGYLLAKLAKSINYKFDNESLENIKENYSAKHS